MNDTISLLESIYKNTEMGIKTMSDLVDLDIDASIKGAVNTQLDEYYEINSQAGKMIRTNGGEIKSISNMAIAGAKLTLNFKTLMDKSPSYIAEMVMKGNANGIIAVEKDLRRFPDADENALKLAKKLLKTEQNNFENLKQFLK